MTTDYQRYISLSRYARWREEDRRRETWEESVERYVNFMYTQVKTKTAISEKDLKELHSILGVSCDG